MSKSDSSIEFVSLLTEHQADLWAFIVSLMPGHPDTKDVLQKTNVLLWKKQPEFESGTNFRAWAFTFARYTVLNHLRQERRRVMLVDEELLEVLASEAPARLGTVDDRLVALEQCLKKLRPEDRELLDHRYGERGGLAAFAERVGRSVSGLSVSLHRLRTALRRCVSQQLSPESR